MHSAPILTVDEHRLADRMAADYGVRSLTLMENAGRAVVEAMRGRFAPSPTAVLCGPGNNGGDGYVVARLLREAGWPVWVESLVNPAMLRGDAAHMAARWEGETLPIEQANRMPVLVVDALFGAGLSRPLEGHARRLAAASHRMRARVIAIDVPSGLHGDTGRPLGDRCFAAGLTVTFHAKKPAHVLMPGRELCGEIVVGDIGIPAEIGGGALAENGPGLWTLPRPAPDGHKYDRGHCVVMSGQATATGAARLAAMAALRVGAGLVTVASPPSALLINALHLTAVMVRQVEGAEGLAALLADERLNAVVVGPGNGVGEGTRGLVRAALESGAGVVLDADALTSFAGDSTGLAALMRPGVVVTPHEGEFERLFPGLQDAAPSRIEAAREAAARLGAVVLLKGADTVVAGPAGEAVVNTNAPAWLATAGAGDVLAGLIAGLMAQGASPFDAACAGAWLHGAAAARGRPGLIAEDLPGLVPAAVNEIGAAPL